MKRYVSLMASVMLASTLISGCAVNRATATVDPSAQLDKLQTVQVKKLPNEDGTVHGLIVDRMKKRGYAVTAEHRPSAPVDATVTYVDKWMWDMTMYLLELTITIRDPKNDYPLATGNSYHTSLTRKSPPEMVDEVLSNIFNAQGKKQ